MWFGLLVLVVALLAAPRRRGHGVNDLKRWKQYGGTLERPPPPKPPEKQQ